MTTELPMINEMNLVSNVYRGGSPTGGWEGAAADNTHFVSPPSQTFPFSERRVSFPGVTDTIVAGLTEHNDEEEEKMADKESTRRLVKVFICDTDEQIPLDNALLYSGPEHLTDLTDEELFFEINIKELLDNHNEVRKQTPDKLVPPLPSGAYLMLEPIRIRNLTMSVVVIAAF